MQTDEDQQQRTSSSQDRRHRPNDQRRERHDHTREDRDRERDRERGSDRNRDMDNGSSSPRASRRRHEQHSEQPLEPRGADRLEDLGEARDNTDRGAFLTEEVDRVAEKHEATEPFTEAAEAATGETLTEAEAKVESAPMLTDSHAGAGQAKLQTKRDSQEQQVMLKAKEDARIEELKATIADLQRQEQEIIKQIRGEGTPSEIIDKHIKDLHRYNEIKDVGQIILGKCAELEGTTVKKQYEEFGLDPED